MTSRSASWIVRRAGALSPADPDPIFRIGVLLSKQERWKEAAAAYDEALTRRPEHAPTHMNLGILSERLGDLTRAIGHYESVLRTQVAGPGDEALQARAREALGQLRSRGGGDGPVAVGHGSDGGSGDGR